MKLRNHANHVGSENYSLQEMALKAQLGAIPGATVISVLGQVTSATGQDRTVWPVAADHTQWPAGVIAASSSSASDTTQTVTVSYTGLDGTTKTVDIALNGQTKVASTITDCKAFVSAELDAGAVGDVYIYSTDATVTSGVPNTPKTMAVIPIGLLTHVEPQATGARSVFVSAAGGMNTVKVSSSSAADTTQTITITYIATDDTEKDSSAITLTGQTAATSGISDFKSFVAAELSAACAGDVYIYASDATITSGVSNTSKTVGIVIAGYTDSLTSVASDITLSASSSDAGDTSLEITVVYTDSLGASHTDTITLDASDSQTQVTSVTITDLRVLISASVAAGPTGRVYLYDSTATVTAGVPDVGVCGVIFAGEENNYAPAWTSDYDVTLVYEDVDGTEITEVITCEITDMQTPVESTGDDVYLVKSITAEYAALSRIYLSHEDATITSGVPDAAMATINVGQTVSYAPGWVVGTTLAVSSSSAADTGKTISITYCTAEGEIKTATATTDASDGQTEKVSAITDCLWVLQCETLDSHAGILYVYDTDSAVSSGVPSTTDLIGGVIPIGMQAGAVCSVDVPPGYVGIVMHADACLPAQSSPLATNNSYSFSLDVDGIEQTCGAIHDAVSQTACLDPSALVADEYSNVQVRYKAATVAGITLKAGLSVLMIPKERFC